jgi:anti-sigma regulatory factor (Ser/Thr protein kinase)
VVAEPASNAVLHGRVRGRDFRLRLTLRADHTLRVEVTDARGDRVPRIPAPMEQEGLRLADGVRESTSETEGSRSENGRRSP